MNYKLIFLFFIACSSSAEEPIQINHFPETPQECEEKCFYEHHMPMMNFEVIYQTQNLHPVYTCLCTPASMGQNRIDYLEDESFKCRDEIMRLNTACIYLQENYCSNEDQALCRDICFDRL